MNGIIILALGDDSWRATVKHALNTMNFDVREVNQGPQAIKDVAVLKPNLVIVDDTLPYLNGYQFCRLLKFGLHLDIPLILIISSEQKMDQFWGSSCGADYCLSKPIDLSELKRIVEQDVRGRKARRHSFFQPPLIIGRNMSDLDILKMANDLLDRHLFQEKVLNELTFMSRQVDSIRDLVSAMMPVLNSLFPFRSAVVFLYHEARASLLVSVMEEIGQDRVESSYTHLLAYIREKEGVDLSLDDIPITLVGPAIPDPEAESEDLEESDISIFFGQGLRSAICCVAFDGLGIETFPEEEAQTFRLILQQVLETIEEKIVFEKSIPFSIIDTVTHETNRSFFLKILTQNMEQARRFQAPLALVGLSLENYQHMVNSLDKKAEFHFRQNIFTTLLNAVRKMDVVARISENRFILVLFKANAEQARTVYQRVKSLLEDLSLPDLPLQVQGNFYSYNPSIGLQAEDFLLVACSRIFSQGPEKSSCPKDELLGNPLWVKDIEGCELEDPVRVKDIEGCELTSAPTSNPDPTCNPQPATRNPQNPQPETRNQKPATRSQKSAKPATRNPKRSLKMPPPSKDVLKKRPSPCPLPLGEMMRGKERPCIGSSPLATIEEVEHESR